MRAYSGWEKSTFTGVHKTNCQRVPLSSLGRDESFPWNKIAYILEGNDRDGEKNVEMIA